MVASDPTANVSSEPATIHVGNGDSVKLCGLSDTWSHSQSNFYRPTSCFSCMAELWVVKDVEYVLCLRCKKVSRTSRYTNDWGRVVGGCSLAILGPERQKQVVTVLRTELQGALTYSVVY